MKIGFTGTQKGMTEAQTDKCTSVLRNLSPTEIHLGDCIGADTEFYELIRDIFPEIKTVGHIPIVDFKRSRLKYTEERAPKGYLVRNKNIVDECQLLIAVPFEFNEQLRSGTWSTVRYARKCKRDILIVYPDGTTDVC